jgi:hypothetical protein
MIKNHITFKIDLYENALIHHRTAPIPVHISENGLFKKLDRVVPCADDFGGEC